MSWQILFAVCLVFSSVAVLLQRVLLHNDKTDPIAYAILFQAIVGVLLLAAAIFHGLELPDFGKYWLPIALTILLFGLGNVVYAKALQVVEASIFAVLFATTSVWVMMGGLYFFDERLAVLQILGTALIIGSVALLNEQGGKIRLNRGIWLGLFTGLLYGLAVIGWIYVGRHNDPTTWNAITFIVPALLILMLSPGSVSKMKPYLARDVMVRVILLGIFVSIASLCLLNAYNHAKASTIAPLVQTEIFITMILAVIFLKERSNLVRKFAAAFVCFAGVLLIVR